MVVQDMVLLSRCTAASGPNTPGDELVFLLRGGERERLAGSDVVERRYTSVSSRLSSGRLVLDLLDAEVSSSFGWHLDRRSAGR
jgi:hypothetical protein